MGILRNGIAGNYSGKIGNLVFYVRNGKQVVRTTGKMTKPPTEGQLKNRKELKVVIDFLKPIKEFINAGFALAAKGTTKIPHNLAVSHNKRYALQGIYPDVEMDYTKVLVTQGKIPDVSDCNVELTAEGLHFTWTCTNNLNWPRDSDQVMLLAYFPVLEKAIYQLAGVKRLVCAETLSIGTGMLNEYMEVYISFVSADRKAITNSIYLGSFNQ